MKTFEDVRRELPTLIEEESNLFKEWQKRNTQHIQDVTAKGVARIEAVCTIPEIRQKQLHYFQEDVVRKLTDAYIRRSDSRQAIIDKHGKVDLDCETQITDAYTYISILVNGLKRDLAAMDGISNNKLTSF